MIKTLIFAFLCVAVLAQDDPTTEASSFQRIVRAAPDEMGAIHQAYMAAKTGEYGSGSIGSSYPKGCQRLPRIVDVRHQLPKLYFLSKLLDP
ncbi:hypothetical protein KM043_000215 [Ampulex compressa]|nr:hypothetical protein KM043_000215 [Ampulex compressa]